MMTITNDAVRHQEDSRAPGGNLPLPRPRSGTTTGRAGQELLDLHQRAGALAGEPLRDLPEVRSEGGILEHTLRIPERQDSVGDVAVDVGGCHTDMPDEILRVRAGDRMKMRLEGAAGSRKHAFQIPAGQPAGAHWYRPPSRNASTHHPLHGLVCPMVVEGDVDQISGIAGIRERIMVVNGLRPQDTTFTLNGQLQPEIAIQPGEIQRWRVFNAEPHHSIWLHLEGHTLHQVGQDGIPFSRTRPTQSIVLAPGNRAEFLVRANKPGEYRLYGYSCDQDPRRPRPATDLATMLVSGRSIFSRLPRELVEEPAVTASSVARSRKVRVNGFTGDATGGDVPGVRFLVEGQEFTPEQAHQEVTAGTVESWTLINDDASAVTLHVGGHPFQVVDVQGGPAGDPSWQTEAHVWRDTYRLPPQGQASIRLCGRESSAST